MYNSTDLSVSYRSKEFSFEINSHGDDDIYCHIGDINQLKEIAKFLNYVVDAYEAMDEETKNTEHEQVFYAYRDDEDNQIKHSNYSTKIFLQKEFF